jgi:acyl-CoA synthetase (AMP-forming)/AMP-acid ligase II
VLRRVLDHPDVARRDLSSLYMVGGGGSPIAPELQAETRAKMPTIRSTLGVGYGLTEGCAFTTINAASELTSFPDSVGRPLPLVDVQIRDEAGQPLPDGEQGEVTVRGPLVMKGYFRDPEATAASLGPGRWLRTGDIGHMEGGRLYLSARRRDLILRGGENVYPAEVELRLEAHEGVHEVAVVGVDHAELGQEVAAIVVPREGAHLDPAELTRFVSQTLAYYKVPAHWEIRTEPLPRNATGKVLKHVLTGEAESTFLSE